MDRRKGIHPTVTTLTLGAIGIASFYAIRNYRRRYRQGQIISLHSYITTYAARRRMHHVIQTMLPLWKSRYDNDTTTAMIQFIKSDIIVFAPPKSGTTWVTHMCHQIRTRGADVEFSDQDDVIPWIERLGTPYLEGSYFNDNPKNATDHMMARPRVFKSHLTWEERPAGCSYKQIWVFRNCVDMMTSVTHFLPSLWGIDPPLNEEEMCSYLLDAGDVESALRSLASAWEHRQDADILVLFYENMEQDHRGTVEAIAKFMDVLLSVSEVDRIVDQTTKGGMLRNHEVFACRIQARNAHKARSIDFDETKLVGKVRRNTNTGMNEDKSDIEAAVQRAWQESVARTTGMGDYDSMRLAK